MTRQEEFWNWFIEHESEQYDFEDRDREKTFDQLASVLQKVDPDLTFEFGPKETRREFVISAGGIKRAFPAVGSLVGAAPPLGRWKITAFRPRRRPGIVEFRGKRVDPEYVQFTLLENGKIAGIYLFIPGFRGNDPDLKQIGYLLLDEVLGEHDVENRLGLIEMLSPDTPTEGERHPLTELPRLFDRLVSQIEARSR